MKIKNCRKKDIRFNDQGLENTYKEVIEILHLFYINEFSVFKGVFHHQR